MMTQAFLFEVMDKEPTLPFIWGFFLILGIVGMVLGRLNPLLVLIVYPLILGYAAMIIGELTDPFVGRDIVREAGYGYVVQSYIAIGAGSLLPVAGIAAWVRRRVSGDRAPVNNLR